MRSALTIAALGLVLGTMVYWITVAGRAPAAHQVQTAAFTQRTLALPDDANTASRTHADQEPIANAIATEPAPTDPNEGEPAPAPRSPIDRLIDAGFSAAYATHIVERESTLRRMTATEEYRANKTIRPLQGTAAAAAALTLRKELGDAAYERYLGAFGQSIAVVIVEVAPDSPAAHAGLLPGDRIETYRGRRVFNTQELNVLQREGDSSGVVPVGIMRDGQPLQLYVSSGPLGIVTRGQR